MKKSTKFIIIVIFIVNTIISLTSSTTSPKLRVLCLHGFLSCGKYMSVQLNQLQLKTDHIVDYYFPDAPHTIQFTTGSKLKSSKKCSWWNASFREDEYRYDGIDISLQYIMQLEKDKGPFDIILGHSQGACMALTLNALTMKPDLLQLIMSNKFGDNIDNKLPSPKNTILMSGFIPRDKLFNDIFQNVQLSCDSLHLFSPTDDVVPQVASTEAMTLYAFPTMKLTTGGHDISRDSDDNEFLVNYINNCYNSKYESVILQD